MEEGAILGVRKLSRGLALAATAAVAIAAGLAAAATAATVVGTAKNDVLNGTTKPDKLYGRGGSDKLYGKGGNDLLVGGPGADRIFCGGGKDTVRADRRDTVAGDCETVTGLTKTSPQPSPPAPPAPPPAPPAPPAAKAVAGRYCGFTNNGYGFCFDVPATGDAFTNAVFEIKTECTPDAIFTATFSTTGATPIKPDLTFSYDVTSGEEAGSYLRGKFDTTGGAAGVVHIALSFNYEGTHYDCRFDTEWTAKIGA
jgi:hypothetical protein